MKNLNFIVTAIVFVLFISCYNNNNRPTVADEFITGVMPAVLQHPESVLYDGKDFFYVSDVGAALAPHVKDGDGKIVKLNKKGQIVEANFAKTTLHAPKGTVIIGSTLYVADIDAIKGIDLATGNLVKTINFNDIGIDLTAPGGTGLNDICEGMTANDLYVSITNNGAIYKVNISAGTKTLVGTVANANGMILDSKNEFLYVCGFTNTVKTIGRISVTTLDYTNLNLPLAGSGYDGIGIIGNRFFISDWGADANGANEKGIVSEFSLQSNTLKPLDLNKIGKTKLNGPADFDTYGDYFFIPAMGEGRVYVYKL